MLFKFSCHSINLQIGRCIEEGFFRPSILYNTCRMHLHCAFLGRIMCPIINGHGQGHQCRIQEFYRHLETKILALPCRLLSEMPKQHIEYVSKHIAVSMGILISDSRLARCLANAQVIEVAYCRLQSVGDVSNQVAFGELTENHTDKLAPCIVAFAMLVGMCRPNNFSDIFFRNLADYLCEKCYICHRK